MARQAGGAGAHRGRGAFHRRVPHGVLLRGPCRGRRGERRRAHRGRDGVPEDAPVPEDLLLPHARGHHVVHRARLRVLLRRAVPHDEEPALRHLLAHLPGDRASVRGAHHDHRRDVDALRMGRVVELGAAAHDLPDSHAHRDRLLRAAKLRGRARAPRDICCGGSHHCHH